MSSDSSADSAEALLALGGNLGSVRETFDRAIALLCEGGRVRLKARSSDYATPPWGVEDQPPFINLCIAVETDLTPHALLGRVQAVEHALGRARAGERRWGPRPIDIDILAYDDVTLDDADLTLPHPRLFERAFVLVPLAEIVPERVIAGRRVREALAVVDTAGISRLAARTAPSPPGRGGLAGAPRRGTFVAWNERRRSSRPALRPTVRDEPEPDSERAMADAPADHLSLAADFPPATRAQWLALVERVLNGAPFDRLLVAKTYDGLPIQPLYEGSPQARALVGRAPGAGWQILQRIDHPDPESANAEARHDRDNGATGLSLVLAGSAGAYGYGVAADAAPIARMFEGIERDAVLEVDAGPFAQEAGRSIASLVRRRGSQASAANVRFGFDPLGAIAAAGAAPLRWSEAAARLGGLVAELAGAGFKGPFAVADGRVIHNAGGSEVQELGFVLAVATSYLRALESAGVGLDQARRMIFFRLTADADQFLTIAKFRALRLLWGRVEEACGLPAAAAFIGAETAWRMMTKRDPYVNMLRATLAVFSAGLGGADGITVLPFTLARGLPDRFARRIARNTQLVLLAESHLAKVADATAGAGVIEDLTHQLCRAAWVLFQEIERSGGAAAALEQGLIQRGVARVRAERQAALARGADCLIGTSDFPDLDEPAVSVLDVAPIMARPPANPTLDPLPCIRMAEPFERLRDASDRMLAESGSRPKIFLANLGLPADFSARATFAKNFFEAGGIAAAGNDGFASADGPSTDLGALAAAFKRTGSPLACLCGSDDVYAREAIAAARALTQAGARHLYYSGGPARAADLAAAGIATFVHAGCNAVAILQAALDRAGGREAI
jgi:methylmalonyl-CoA mutase